MQPYNTKLLLVFFLIQYYNHPFLEQLDNLKKSFLDFYNYQNSLHICFE